jgi:cell division septum initiation protein DivIVA
MSNGNFLSGEPRPAHLDAHGFRACLEQRRAVADVLAESTAARRQAADHAAEIVRLAEALAEQIVAEARVRAARITADAEAARTSPPVSDQVTATIGRLEALSIDVQMALDSAVSDVVASLSPRAEPPSEEGGTTQRSRFRRPRG